MIRCEVEVLPLLEHLTAVLMVLGWDPRSAVCGRNRRYGEVPEIVVSLVSVPSK